MKYIRTKDGVYLNGGKFGKPYAGIVGKKREIDFGFCFDKKDIIAQDDTIEELCDEFVQFLPNSIRPCIMRNKMRQAELKDFLLMNKLNQWKLYGAIWTGKGLIYVAKMNVKGELELL